MIFSDNDDMEPSNGSGRLLTRRAAFAGTAVGTFALASAGLMGCSVAGAGTSDASSADNELTDEQKKLHKQIVATYNVEKQAAIKEKLDAEYAADSYDETTPFVKADPFGTDTLSCYVRFATTDPVAVSYEVAGRKKFVDSPKVAAFSRTPRGGETPATDHEFKVIGLIPNHKNTVTLTCAGQDGTSRSSKFTVKTPAFKGEEEERLAVTAGESNTPLADGLFTILGNDSSKLDFMYLYDNAGQIRGEVPIIGYRSHRLLFPGDGSMIMSVSTTKMAQINAIGQVVNVWSTGDYELHHDYAFDDDGNLLVLASHVGSEADLDIDRAAVKKDKGERVNVEDLIIKIDVTTGDVSLVLDLGDIFPDLKANAKVAQDGDLDWIHINTIQWLGNGAVLLSSRETSTVFKLTDIYGTPTVDWLMGSPDFWAGSGFEDKLLQAQGDFTLNAGQHSVTYLPNSDTATTGRYQVLLYDNNFGAAESYPKFDWGQLGAAVVTDYSKGTHSFGRIFAVDETARAYELEDQIAVPFSGYVSSAQRVGSSSSMLVASGQAKTFTEYDRYGLPIATYEMEAEKFIYRVYKYEL